MNSNETIKQIKEILNRNYIKTSNIRKHKKSYVLNIHDQDAIKKFFNIVKPNNPYHRERFLKWIKSTK
jgi:DNA-binding transcriptional regulator WhiA